jgi:hypothetical protein
MVCRAFSRTVTQVAAMSFGLRLFSYGPNVHLVRRCAIASELVLCG